MEKNKKLQTIIVWAENKPGVLNRMFTLIRRRNFNVETITAGHTHVTNISRITITFNGSEAEAEQLSKQLYKILEVIKVSEAEEKASVNRELALIKVKFNLKQRAEIMEMVKNFRANVISFKKNSVIIEITGKEKKIDALVEVLRPYGIQALARTGRVSMLK